MRWLALVLVLSAPVAARAQTTLRTIDLGDGMSASLVRPGYCIGLPMLGCAVWSAVGLDLSRPDSALAYALTFVRVPGSPRILASIPTRYRYSGRSRNSVLYTDDRGASWSAARWPSANAPTAIAFSEDGSLGIAVGPSQGIWSSEDRGLSWQDRSSSAGLAYVDVAVQGRTVVVVDEGRAAWVSRDRGSALESAADRVNGPLRTEPDAVVVPTERGEVRIDREGRRVR
jgi:hypothetical protein